MSKVIIEVSESNNNIIQKHSFNNFPVRIGRGYQNDIILSDPYVCSEHLNILENKDEFILKDNDSENGIFINNKRIKDNELSLASGTYFKIGNTTIQIFSEKHIIPKSLKFDFWSTFYGKILFKGFAYVSLIALLLTLMLDLYLRTYKIITISKLLNEALIGLLMVTAWTVLWGVIGFLIKRKAYFHSHLLITSLYLIALIELKTFIECISFYFNSSAINTYLGGMYAGILVGFLLYFNFKYSISSVLNKKKQIIISSIIGISVSCIFLVNYYAAKKSFEPTLELPIVLKPPIFKPNSSIKIDEFLKESNVVFE